MFHISKFIHGQYLRGKRSQVQFHKGHSLPDRPFQTTLLFLQGQTQAGDLYPLMMLGKLADEAGGLSSCVFLLCLGFVAICRAQMCCYSPALWGTEGLRAGAAGGERLLPGAIPMGCGMRGADGGCGMRMRDAGCGTEPPAVSQLRAPLSLAAVPTAFPRWQNRAGAAGAAERRWRRSGFKIRI